MKARCSSIKVQQVAIIFTKMYVRWQWMSKAICRNKVSERCQCPGRWARVSSFTRFLCHTQRRTTVGRTPLDEWSARRRDFYLKRKTLHSQQTDIHASGGIKTQNLSRRATAELRLIARPLGSAHFRPLPIQNELLLATSVISWSHVFMNVANAFGLHILWHCDTTLRTEGSGV